MHVHCRAMNSIMNLLVFNTRGFLRENQSYQSQLNASALCWLKEKHPMFTLLLYIVAFRACTGADPGFFLGGGAPLRNGVTNTNKPHFLQNTSCITKP